MNYGQLVQDIIKKYKDSPIALLENGKAGDEWRYLNWHKDSYSRTIRDIDSLWAGGDKKKSILEIGSYLGLVSLALKEIGYNVSALDIPEYQQSSALKAFYEKNGIPFTGLNLRGHKLPYESNSLDAVIACEIIEHLNFNPLPVLKEINRVLKKGGYLYIGMPNQARIQNRIKLLLGKSVHNSIDDFLRQLNKDANMLVGLHWREYTLAETVQLLERMGFEITRKYYFVEKEYSNYGALAGLLAACAYVIPSLRPFQVVTGKKVSEPTHNFWLTDANS
jgi:SAM-dependent methyltransferase